MKIVIEDPVRPVEPVDPCQMDPPMEQVLVP